MGGLEDDPKAEDESAGLMGSSSTTTATADASVNIRSTTDASASSTSPVTGVPAYHSSPYQQQRHAAQLFYSPNAYAMLPQQEPFIPHPAFVAVRESQVGQNGVYLSGDLFSCFSECNLCAYGLCCASCLFADNVARLDTRMAWMHSCLLYGAVDMAYCIMACVSPVSICTMLSCSVLKMATSAVLGTPVRATLRSKYGLPAQPCGDTAVHFFCSPCALCQEAREMKVRGLYPGGRTIVVV